MNNINLTSFTLPYDYILRSRETGNPFYHWCNPEFMRHAIHCPLFKLADNIVLTGRFFLLESDKWYEYAIGDCGEYYQKKGQIDETEHNALYLGWTNVLPLPEMPTLTSHRPLKDLTLGERSDEFSLPFFCRDYQSLHELSDRLTHKLPLSAAFQAAEWAQIFSEIEQIGVAYWRLYLPENDEISIHNPYQPTFRLPEFYWLDRTDAQQRTHDFVDVFLAQFPDWHIAETPDWWRHREHRSDAYLLFKPFADTHLVVNVSLDCRRCQ